MSETQNLNKNYLTHFPFYRILLPDSEGKSDSLLNNYSNVNKYRFVRVVSNNNIFHTVFDDDEKLMNYVIDNSDVTCHEISLGPCNWFGDFDFEEDYSSKYDDIVLDFINSSSKVFGIELNYYIVFTSGNKSIHIICPEVNIENSKHFRYYANKVKDNMKYYSQYVDIGVYRTRAQLRMLGSQKDGRKKLFDRRLSKLPPEYYHSDNKKLSIFKLSLLSTKNHCLKTTLKAAEENNIEGIDANNYFEKISNLLLKFDNSYRIQCITDSIIILKRNRPSFCYICNRVHHNENPFLVLKNNGEVRFFCRRNVNKFSKKIGVIEDIASEGLNLPINFHNVLISNWYLSLCSDDELLSIINEENSFCR